MNTTQTTHEESSKTHQHPLNSDTSIPFATSLRHIYKQQDKIAPLIEGVIPEQSMKQYYVKLQTIIKEDDDDDKKKTGGYEGVSGEKRGIEISGLFDKIEAVSGSQDAYKILLLGGAGVGKSTLMQYMAYKWSQGQIWNDRFDYVYRIALKTILNDEWTRGRYLPEEIHDSELKCLAHYHLTANFTKAERATLKPKDLVWPSDKSRVLLLLDGYDEVAHLRTTEECKDMFDEIFEHRYIILTSRPNAVDKDMKAKFDRKIENTGLDGEGIEQYLQLYFTSIEDGEARSGQLKAFLKSNTNIKEICKVPVNIAMLCYIWAESAEEEVSQGITNMSDLYTQVVDQLGFRYYFKTKYKGVKHAGKDLRVEWESRNLQLDEIKILEHVAYKGMTGGGIEVPDEKRVETLIIKGAINKKDKDGISIRSSINKLNPLLKEQNLGIEDVYRYGVLKTEGLALTDDSPAKKSNEQAADDTKLASQNYSFIHLTFQEYLTATYLKNKLTHGSTQEKEQVCQYLAEHRNEPRYLMTLKFLAGVITADTDPDGDAAARMFWEAMSCNVDGILELGVGNKVVLLMHLLSQARREARSAEKNEGRDDPREIDARIPNKEVMTDLIDIVVVQNLTSWGSSLQETDYMTANIRHALHEALHNRLDCNRVIDEILSKRGVKGAAAAEAIETSDEKALRALKTAVERVAKNTKDVNKLVRARTMLQEAKGSHARMEEKSESSKSDGQVMVILSSLINTNSHDEQQRFVNYLVEVIANKSQHDWQLVKLAIESLMKMLASIKLTQEQVREAASALANLISDSNLGRVAVEAMVALVQLEHTIVGGVCTEALNKACTLFEDPDENIRISAINEAMEITSINPNPKTVHSTLDKVSALVGDSYGDVRATAAVRVRDLLSFSPTPETVQSALDKISALLADPDYNVRVCVADAFLGVVHLSPTPEAVRSALDKVCALLADPDLTIKFNSTYTIIDILKLSPTPEAVQFALDKADALLQDEDRDTREYAARAVGKIIRLSPNPEVGRPVLERITALLADLDSNVRYFAAKTIKEILEVDSPLPYNIVQPALDKASALLGDSNSDVRDSVAKAVIMMLKLSSTPETVHSALDTVGALLGNSDLRIRSSAVSGFSNILKLNLTPEVVHLMLDKMSALLADSDDTVKERAIEGMIDIVKQNPTPEAVQFALDKVSALLEDSYSLVSRALEGTIDIIRLNPTPEAVQFGLDKVSALLENSYSGFRVWAINGVTNILRASHTLETAHSTLVKVSALLEDPDTNVKASAIDGVINILELSLTSEAVQAISDKVTPLLADSDRQIRCFAAKRIVDILKLNSTPEAAHSTLVKVSALLEDSDTNVKASAIDGVINILELSSTPETVQTTLDKVTPLLADSDRQIRDLAAKRVVDILKLNSTPEAAHSTLVKVSALLEDPDANIKASATNSIIDILKLSPAPEAMQATLEKVSALFTDLDFSIRNSTFRRVIDILELNPTPEAVQATLDKVSALLADPDTDIKISIISNIIDILKLNPTPEAVQATLDKINAMLVDSESQVRVSAAEKVAEILKLNHSSESARSTLDKLIALLADSDWNISNSANRAIVDILRISPTPEAVQAVLDKVSALLASSNSKITSSASNAIAAIFRLNPGSEMVHATFDKVCALLEHSDPDIRDSVHSEVSSIIYLNINPETVHLALEKASSLLAASNSRDRDKDHATELIGTAMYRLSTTTIDFRKYVNHVDAKLRNIVSTSLMQGLKKLLVVTERDQSNVDALSIDPCHTNMSDHHKLIAYALMIIGYDDITTAEYDRKELITAAKKLLNYKIDRLDDHGLKWLNDHFTELATLSSESKVMMKKVFHKIASDLEQISDVKKALIIKLIKEGLTTSLTRRGEVILEGKKYRMHDSDAQTLLEEIAKTVISQDSDILANQYRDHNPIFPKSDGIGMRRASSDIERLSSVLSKNYTLSSNQWMLTSLIQERLEGGEEAEILLLEQRNSMGDHSLHALNTKLQPQLRVEMNSDDERHNKRLLEAVFGAYKEKTVYNAKMKVLSDAEGARIAGLNNKVQLAFAQIEGEYKGTQKYFQDELLNQGHQDRLAYVDRQLAQKVTNNTVALQHALESCRPPLHSQEVQKLEEYYSAFILTFSSLYTASQAVDSGQLSVDTSNLTTAILSTLASFAPFGIGDKLSGGIEKINDFVTGNKMANEAKLMKKLADDAVALSSVVGDVGLKIVLNKAYQKKITTTAVEDPSGIIGKLHAFIARNKDKLADYHLAEKELHRTPAAALGEHDANTLIKEWLTQASQNTKESRENKAQDDKAAGRRVSTLYIGMRDEDLKAEFIQKIVGEASSESNEDSSNKSPNKKVVKVSAEEATATGNQVTPKGDDKHKGNDGNNNRSGCCEIFRVEIRYHNPVLNNMDLMTQLAKQFMLSQIVEASHRFVTNGDASLLVEAANKGDIKLLEEVLIAALNRRDSI